MDNSEVGINHFKLPPVIVDQIKTIDQSLAYSFISVIGIILSWYSSYTKKQQLLCSVIKAPCCDSLPSTYQIECLSNTLIIISVVFSFCLAKRYENQPSKTCKEKQSKIMCYSSSLMVLIAAVIRFAELILTGQELEPTIA